MPRRYLIRFVVGMPIDISENEFYRKEPIMKKVILSILVTVAVFFVIVLIQTLIKNMTFTEALSRPYNYFLAAIAFMGTFSTMSRKEK